MGDVFQADTSGVLSDSNIHWDSLRGATILVTGATGLIGGVLVTVLSAANEKFDLNLHIVGHGRNKNKGDNLAQSLGIEFVCGDIRTPSILADTIDGVDYIFHCAAITKSADMVASPVDVITTSVDGTRNMLELARVKGCKSFVFLSSMEVYGQTESCEVRENDMGYLDLTNPRSSYPESKRFCEMLCISYAAQYKVPVRLARLARTFGAGTPNSDNDMRVANQFARKALAGENIELHTYGNSIANCCYTFDAVRGLLIILLEAKIGEVYNVVNPNASATIREMAEIVANEVCDGKIRVIVNEPGDLVKRGYTSDVRYTLNADKLKALGWSPQFGLADMYRRMLTDWKKR